MNTLLNALQNKHTTGSALAIALLKIAGIIWPQKKSVFDEITAVAVVWLGIAAGDAANSKAALDDLAAKTAAAISSGDTTQLLKKDIPPALLPISPGKSPGNPS